MLVFADRVKENATVEGTSLYTLTGASIGFQSFATAFADGARLQYCAESGTRWEVGEGVFNAVNGTLSRDIIFSSSNNGAAVDWPAGSVKVFCVAASSAIQRSANRGLIVATNGTLAVLAGNTRWYAQQPVTFAAMDAWVGVASSGSDILFTLRKNGLFALSGSITDGAFRMPSTSITLAMAAEEWLTLDITQVGANTPGKEPLKNYMDFFDASYGE
ncbi:MAG: hypothetical protein HQM03_21595, partial [Magnetococcales bacterium]|nr:hypothetical protein [Magnetococcales bacterium]